MVLAELNQAYNALSSVVGIHSSLKYVQNQMANRAKGYTYSSPVITLTVTENTGFVNKPLIFSGTTTIPGIVEIYSGTEPDEKLERNVCSVAGRFFTTLYFSKPGEYILYAKILNHESNNVIVEIDQ